MLNRYGTLANSDHAYACGAVSEALRKKGGGVNGMWWCVSRARSSGSSFRPRTWTSAGAPVHTPARAVAQPAAR